MPDLIGQSIRKNLLDSRLKHAGMTKRVEHYQELVLQCSTAPLSKSLYTFVIANTEGAKQSRHPGTLASAIGIPKTEANVPLLKRIVKRRTRKSLCDNETAVEQYLKDILGLRGYNF